MGKGVVLGLLFGALFKLTAMGATAAIKNEMGTLN
jgi:hypothetical protein